MRDLPRIFPYLRPYRKLMGGSVAMIGLGTLLSLIAPWPLAILVDCVLGDKPIPSILGPLAEVDTYTLLVIAVVAGFLITAAEQGITVLDDYVSTKLEQKMVLDFRSDLFQHAQRLSLTFHDENATGGLMYRINNQADAMGSITTSIAPLLQALLTLVGMLYITFRIDLQLALLSLTVVPLIYYSAGYYARNIEPEVNEVQTMEGAVPLDRPRGDGDAARHRRVRARELRVQPVPRAGRGGGRRARQADRAPDDVLARRQHDHRRAARRSSSASAPTSVLQGELTVGELLIVMSLHRRDLPAARADQPARSAAPAATSSHCAWRCDLLDTEPEVEGGAGRGRARPRQRRQVTFENVELQLRQARATR